MIKLKLKKVNKLYNLIKLSKIYKKNKYNTFTFGNINLLDDTLYFKYYAILLLNKNGTNMTKGLIRIFLKIISNIPERW